jgi:hypothetical protein
MSERFTKLSELLKPTHDTGDLTYSDIRKEMLKLPDINPSLFFFSNVPIDIAFGDIGYMKDDVFVKLDNMREAFTDHEGEAIKGSEDFLTASGPYISEDLGDGVIRLVHFCCAYPLKCLDCFIRHSFEDAVYIEISRREHVELLSQVHRYWPLFIDKARELLRSCGGNFSVTDLLFGWWDSSIVVEVCHNSLFVFQ